VRGCPFWHPINAITYTHNHFCGPFSRITRVSRYQKKKSSSHLHHPPFLRQMLFLPKPSQFILAWDRHQICWLAYPAACLTLSMDWKSQMTDCNHDNHPRLTLKLTVSDSNRWFIYDSHIFAVNCLNLQISVFAIMMHRVSLHIERCHMINMAANK